MAEQTKALLGRYLPLKMAGQGGFATVYVAKDLLMQRKVAIKVITLSEYDSLRADWLKKDLAQDVNRFDAENSLDPDLLAELEYEDFSAFKNDSLNDSSYDGLSDGFSDGFGGGSDGGLDDSSNNVLGENPSHYNFYLEDDIFSEYENPSVSSENALSQEPTRREDGTFPTVSLLEQQEGDEYSQRLSERFLAQVPGLDEARAAASLLDSHIVTLYDCQIDQDKVYLIMEYVEGWTLTEFKEQYDDQLTLNIISYIIGCIAQALKVAHAKGVLHFDIKPDNVLIDAEGNVKVTDFGLATLMDSQGKGFAGGGTIGYMPLEQMNCRDLDARTDEWSLASICYELLVGENPFITSTLEEAKRAVVGQELTLPSLCWDGLSEELDDVMFDALDPDPRQRYKSVSAFSSALLPLLGLQTKGKEELVELLASREEEQQSIEEQEQNGLFARFFVNLLPFKGKRGEESEAGETPNQTHNGVSQETKANNSKNKKKEEKNNAKKASKNQAKTKGGTNGARPSLQECLDAGDRVSVKEAFFASFSAAPATRVFAALLCLLCMLFALNNIPQTAGLTNPLLWIISLTGAALSAIKPNGSSFLALAALVVSFAVNGYWLMAILLAILLLAWWVYAARVDALASLSALLFVVASAFGFVPVAALLAGFYVRPQRAAATVLFGSFLCVVLAALGSGNLLNWEFLLFNQIANVALYEHVINLLTQVHTWILVLSWVLAAVVFAFLCLFRKHFLSVLGAVLAGIVLMIGVWIAFQFVPGSLSIGEAGMIPDMSYLVPVVVATAAATFAAAVW